MLYKDVKNILLNEKSKRVKQVQNVGYRMI